MNKMIFSQKEIKDLAKAWIIISLIFTIAFGARTLDLKNLFLFIISGVTVGLGFLLHELAHKYFAQKYKCWAEFRSFDSMLFIALLLSFIGVIFAAPGAVMIRGNINTRKNGIISLAGPVTNVVLGVLFILIALIPGFKLMGSLGAQINFFLALFNMIPFAIFDGAKVWKWNKQVYIITVVVAFVLLSSLKFIV